MSGGVLTYTAGGGITNTITVTKSGTNFIIEDTADEIQPLTPSCTNVGSINKVSCSGVTAIHVYLGDGNDTFWGSLISLGTVVYGGSGADTIVGTTGNDWLLGESGNDIVHGLQGEDVIIGGDDNDELYGHDGNDHMEGQNGADELEGDNGNDTLWGGADSDVLHGEGGNDSLAGGDGDDVVNGGPGLDELEGEGGNDLVYGAEGEEDSTLTCGDGNADHVVYDMFLDEIEPGSGCEFQVPAG